MVEVAVFIDREKKVQVKAAGALLELLTAVVCWQFDGVLLLLLLLLCLVCRGLGSGQ